MKELFAVFLCAVSLAGCGHNPEKSAFKNALSTDNAPTFKVPELPCTEALHTAVLDKLQNKFPTYNNMEVYFDHYNVTEADFQREQVGIDRIRAWDQKLTDRCTRDAYEDWLDYYQRELDAARLEMQTHTEEKQMKQYNEENARRRDAERQYKIPEPPRQP